MVLGKPYGLRHHHGAVGVGADVERWWVLPRRPVTSATLTIAGTLDVTGSSALGLQGSAKLVNPGDASTCRATGQLLDQSGTTSISNSGTLEKTGGSGTSVVGQNGLSRCLRQLGTVKVTSGTLSILCIDSSGASDTGSYSISSGTDDRFRRGHSAVSPSAATITGSGTFAVDGTPRLLQNTSVHVPSVSGLGTIRLSGTGGFGHLVLSGAPRRLGAFRCWSALASCIPWLWSSRTGIDCLVRVRDVVEHGL